MIINNVELFINNLYYPIVYFIKFFKVMENEKTEEIRIKKEMLLKNQKKYSYTISKKISSYSPNEQEKLNKYKENRLYNLEEFKQQQIYKAMNNNFPSVKSISSNLGEQNSMLKTMNGNMTIGNNTFNNNFYSSNSSTRRNSIIGMNSLSKQEKLMNTNNFDNFMMNNTAKSRFGANSEKFNKTHMGLTSKSFFNPNMTGGFGKTKNKISHQNENNNSNISEYNILRPQSNLDLQTTISNLKYESMVKNLKTYNHEKNSISLNNLQNFSTLNIPAISNNPSVIHNNEIKSPLNNSQTIQSGINQNFEVEENNKKEENLEISKLYRYLVKGHTFKSQRTKSFKALSKEEKEEILKKFNLIKDVTKLEKEELKIMIDQNREKFLENTSQMKTNLPRINVVEEFFYKDPIKSYKNIKLNKQLYDNMMNVMTSEQVKKYDEIYSNVSKRNLKIICCKI
jgi:hypothetical protein